MVGGNAFLWDQSRAQEKVLEKNHEEGWTAEFNIPNDTGLDAYYECLKRDDSSSE